MNARSLIVLGILMVLGVALFGILFGTLNGGGGSGSQISSPWTEFSATAVIHSSYGGFQFNYSISVYSHMTFSGLNLVGWDLEAQVDYPDVNNATLRNVYYNGYTFFGETTGGFYNVSGCLPLDQSQIVNSAAGNFVPQQLFNNPPFTYSAMCVSSNGLACTIWQLTLGPNQTFNMWVDAATNVPQILVSRDFAAYVTSFSFGKTWSPSYDPSWKSLCPSDPNATNPSLPLTTPPANQDPNVFANGSGTFTAQAVTTGQGGASTFAPTTTPDFMHRLLSHQSRVAESAPLVGAADAQRALLERTRADRTTQQLSVEGSLRRQQNVEAMRRRNAAKAAMGVMAVDTSLVQNIDAVIADHIAERKRRAAAVRKLFGQPEPDAMGAASVESAAAKSSPSAESANSSFSSQVVSCAGSGNGYCDLANNNQACNWDGGDCCAGTCSSTATYACGSAPWQYVCSSLPSAQSEQGFSPAGGNLGSKPCLFLHGLGRSGPNTFTSEGGRIPDGYSYFSSNSGNNYWGNMPAILQGVCTYYDYAFFDTTNNGWDSPMLMNRYYTRALQIYQAGGVIFAHSMGNAILAGACLLQGQCGVRWYGVGSPCRGSSAAASETAIYDFFHVPLAHGDVTMQPNYNWLRSGPVGPEQLAYRHATGHLMKGLLCGNNAYGGGGLSGIALQLVGCVAYGCTVCTKSVHLWWIGDVCYSWGAYPTDGLVSVDECANYGWYQYGWHYAQVSSAQGQGFGGSGSPFAQLGGNHYDITGNMGNVNGISDWYRNMALRG